MLSNHLSNASVTSVAVGPSPSPTVPAQPVCLNQPEINSNVDVGQFVACLPLPHFTHFADGELNNTSNSSCQNRRPTIKRSKSTAQCMRCVSYLVLQKPRVMNCEPGNLPSIRTPSAQRVYSRRCEILFSVVLLISTHPTGRRARRIDRCICCGICSKVCVCLSSTLHLPDVDRTSQAREHWRRDTPLVYIG
jgi:hypothetical protein